MIKLIKNELIKIFKQKIIYIMLILLIAFVIINNILYARAYPKNKSEKYLEEAQTEYNELLEAKEQLNQIGDKNKTKQKQYKVIEGQMEIDKYIIDSKQNVNAIGNNRYVLANLFARYDIFIIIYVILIAGTIISKEFNKGTIKLLLIKPYKRIQILFSKFITCIIMLLLMTIILIISQVLIGGIILDFSSLSVPIVAYNQTTNAVEFINVFQYVGIDFLARVPMYLILLALAFSCSTLLLNSAIAIVIPILVYIFSATINDFVNGINAKWMRFIVTLNWNFEPYIFGGKPEIKSLTFGFAVFICILYFLLIMIPTIWNFKKRDIKNI